MVHDTPDPDDVDAMEMNGPVHFLPDVIGDLKELISVPSVAFPGIPAGAGVPDGGSNGRSPETVRAVQMPVCLDIPGGYPVVYREISGSTRGTNGSALRPL